MQRPSQSQDVLRLTRVSLITPLCVLLLASLVLWQWQGEVSGKSALLGGLIAFLPALYFCFKTLRLGFKAEARQIVSTSRRMT